MLSTQEISTLRSPDMWRVNRMTPGLGLLAKHPVAVEKGTKAVISVNFSDSITCERISFVKSREKSFSTATPDSAHQ